eukprot:TRINITY_DN19766_c0_g1_i1.p1 TRINITY_DN19766_c0_g1~~TRINITY_DN19766_c0_g1_i1.p1  ORF type:complete len:755 (-),score=191.37 TRINITY_DN19766_c0_g1_i1:8-2272(-)
MAAADRAQAGRDALQKYLETTLSRLESQAPSPADLREKAMPSVASSIHRMVAGAPSELKDGVHDVLVKHKVLPNYEADLELFKSGLAAISALLGSTIPSAEQGPVLPIPAKGGQKNTLGHPLRGISVDYLCTTFLAEVAGAGLEPTARVYEIEPLVIRAKSPSASCPRDSRSGLAYIDCLCEGEAGLSTHMLSYTWVYRVGDIADSLELFCRAMSLRPTDTFFWICCLCINQHRVKEAQAKKEVVPFEQFKEEFGSRVASIGHVVALMSPWNDPAYTKRVWCDFEMYTAAQMGEDKCKVSVIMPPAEAADMRKTLTSGPISNPKLWEALQNVRIEHAEASCPEDKDRIFELINTSTGFHDLNCKVAKCLQDWIVVTSEDILKSLDDEVNTGQVAAQEAARTCARLGYILRDVFYNERALDVLKRAVELFKTTGLTDTLDWAVLMSNFGAQQRRCNQLPEALATFDRAEKIFKRIGQTNTLECALLFNSSGAARRANGDLLQALEAFERGLDILEDAGAMHTEEAAMLLNSYSAALRSAGDAEGALRKLEKAMRILEDLHAMEIPLAGFVLNSVGATRRHLRDFPGAVDAFRRAIHVMEKLGTMETESGMNLWWSVGSVKRQMNDADGSFEAFEAARAIGEKAGLMDSDIGARIKEVFTKGKGKNKGKGKDKSETSAGKHGQSGKGYPHQGGKGHKGKDGKAKISEYTGGASPGIRAEYTPVQDSKGQPLGFGKAGKGSGGGGGGGAAGKGMPRP